MSAIHKAARVRLDFLAHGVSDFERQNALNRAIRQRDEAQATIVALNKLTEEDEAERAELRAWLEANPE